jgi:hypothetical protein
VSLAKVTVGWSAAMTHIGGHLGIPAIQRHVPITGITVACFRNWKIIQGWDNWDQAALRETLSASTNAASAGNHGDESVWLLPHSSAVHFHLPLVTSGVGM